VWALLDEEVTEHVSRSNDGDARAWVAGLIQTLKHDDLTKVLVTLWAIWHARRKAIHEQIFQSPLSIFGFVNSFLADLKLTDGVQTKKCPLTRRPNHQHVWVPPPPGMYKVSVDAALSKTRIAGAVGTICRDENGVYLGASARVFEGISDPATLEAFACSEGLALAQDLSLKNVQVTTDCLVISRSIDEGSLASYSPVLMEIKDRRRQFNRSTVIYERRTCNVEAHNFATFSVALQTGRQVWLGSFPDPFFVPKNVTI
jgi:ribonuclease HI